MLKNSKKDEKNAEKVEKEEVLRPSNEELKAQIDELTADLQRTRADFENYRKQVELQRTQAVQIAKEATVEEILPLLDNLKLAFLNYKEELAPLAKSFEKTLSELDLKEISAEIGAEFNPVLHEAVMVDGSEGEKEIVVEVLRPGYYYKGEILRPSMVKVGRK